MTKTLFHISLCNLTLENYIKFNNCPTSHRFTLIFHLCTLLAGLEKKIWVDLQLILV